MSKLIAILAILIVGATISSSETVKVLSTTNAIRQECRFFAPSVAKVNYNDELTILEDKGDWHWVEFYGVEGCIHNTAIKERKVALTDIEVSEDARPVSHNEVTLAGKGFFAELYEFNNPDVKFGTLESIESFEVSDEQLREFAFAGKLIIR
jgi:hypothetical protein